MEEKIAAFVSEDVRVLEELSEEFDLVISDRDDLCDEVGCEFYCLEHDEDEILELLEEKGVSKAIAVGYKRLFSGEFVEECGCELLNLHPSLLPKFKGLNVYRRVAESDEELSGATLHRIVEEMDEGEVIDQVMYEVPDGGKEELKEEAKEHEVKLVKRNL